MIYKRGLYISNLIYVRRDFKRKCVELNEGDRVLRKKSIDFLKNTDELQKTEMYVKFFLKSASVLAREKLSSTEIAVCLEMLQYIRYDTGYLAYENGVKLTLDDIKRKCDFTSNISVVRAVDELVNKKIFAKVKTGKENNYLVNPYIFMRGARVNKTLSKTFEYSRWARLYS